MLLTPRHFLPSPPSLEASLIEALQSKLTAGIAQKSQRPKLSLPDWMREARPYLRRGVAFDLEHHPFLESIYADTSPELVLMKGGQMGLSEHLLSLSYWVAGELGYTVLYVMPTEDDVSDFSTQRIGVAFEPDVSPMLFKLVREAGIRGADRVGLKRIGDGWLYLRGGKVKPDGTAAQLHSIPADLVILDEFDLIDYRALALIEKRLGHSDMAWKRLASTPTYHEHGIHAEYLATDRRAWFVRCSHCGNRQPLSLDDCIIERDSLDRPVAWHGGAEPFIACRKCKLALDRSGPGEWVAELESHARRGYHVNGLASPYKSLSDILGIGTAEDGKPRGLMSVDETVRKQVINQDLGLPYTPRASTRLTDVILENCKRDYIHGPVVKGEGVTFMGVDVGGALHVTIRDAQKRQRYAGAVSSFETLAALIDEHKVGACVIDALPETRKAREFQRAFPDKVWLCYYNRAKQGSKDIKEAVFNRDDRTVDADRTRTLDATYALFIRAAQGEAGNTLPADIRRVADYYNHMKAPLRTLVKGADGIEVAVYIESGADHYAHSENYCHVASLAPLGWVRGS